MKMYLLSALVLFSINSFAMKADVRLEVSTTPNSPTKGFQDDSVLVLANGTVIHEVRNSVDGKLLTWQRISTVSADEMTKINEEIEAARDGVVAVDVHQIHCMAISFQHTTYRADNGNVTLLKTALCQDPTINHAPEATELVSEMAKFLKIAQNFPTYVVQCQNDPEIADAGYNVGVTLQNAGIMEAQVGEETFAGETQLGTMFVGRTDRAGLVVFNDSEGGNAFNLTVDLTKPAKAEKGYLSTFSFSQNGKEASGNLVCQLNPALQ